MVSINYSNYKSFADLHTESIMEYCNSSKPRKFKTSILDALINTHFVNIVSDFESLVRASPATLQRLKHEFDHNISTTNKTIIRNNFNVKGLYKYFTKEGFANSRLNIIYNSNYLADKLDIFTCPYCNENFTYYFSYKGGKSDIRRIFDWDHIYSKTDYPFLAISFYNLVPCCKVCNQIKLDQNFEYFNPHTDVDLDNLYFYALNPIEAGYIGDSSKIQLNIAYSHSLFKDQIKVTADTVGLLSRMRCHKELIKDILNKKRFFPDPYLNFVENKISLLNFPNIRKAELKQTLYGVHFNQNEYFKRPFSKLTSDILKF